jgi:ABC-type glycerol-3-phosphate transport system substrate-binding protein
VASPTRLALIAALALAGCGGGADAEITGGGKLGGSTLTVYSLTPDPEGAARDEVDGQKLALSDQHGKVGPLAVNFAALDLGKSDAAAAEATRRAISDPQIIAAVVDATPTTAPLLNAAGILQVAPGGDAGLVSDPQAEPSGRRTLAPLDGQAVPPGFAARFKAAFGRAPGERARTGYAAMHSVLRAIARAGARGNDRSRVIAAYFSPRGPRPG